MPCSIFVSYKEINVKAVFVRPASDIPGRSAINSIFPGRSTSISAIVCLIFLGEVCVALISVYAVKVQKAAGLDFELQACDCEM